MYTASILLRLQMLEKTLTSRAMSLRATTIIEAKQAWNYFERGKKCNLLLEFFQLENVTYIRQRFKQRS